MKRANNTRKRIIGTIALLIGAGLIAFVVYFMFIYEKPEKGEINDVKIENAVQSVDTMSDGEKPEAQFKKHKSSLPYEFTMLKNGRGLIKVPYPKGWSIGKYSDYDIVFQAPDDDKYFPGQRIFYHSTLEPQAITSSHDIVKQFNSKISSDNFLINGVKKQLSPGTSLDKRVIDKDISNPNLQLYISYQDNDCLTTDYENKSGLYHQTTAFYWYGIPMILTGMTQNENSDNLNDLLLTMMSNAEYERDTLGDTVPVKGVDLTFEMPPLYEKVNSAGIGALTSYSDLFICPPDTGTGFSHSSVGVYTISDTNWNDMSDFGKDFESELMPALVKDTFGSSVDTNYILGYMDQEMDGYIEFGGRKAKEYVYRFSFSKTNGMTGCFVNQEWIIAAYPIKHKHHVDVLTLVTTQGGLPCSMEVIEKIAQTITY